MTFNWQEFMSGKLVVQCETEELAYDFFEACRKRDIEVGSDIEVGHEWGYRFVCSRVLFNSVTFYRDHDYEVVVWQPNTSLDFFNTVLNLKEGDVYKCGDKYAKCMGGYILVGDSTGCVSFSTEDKFEKVRETVNNEVALKAMIEGKVVKLVSNDHKYRLNKDLKVEVCSLLGWMERCTMTDFLSKGKENEWIILG